MWSVAILRFIRRRIVLGIILALSFTYCIVSLMNEDKNQSENETNDVTVRRTRPFVWRTLQEHNSTNNDLSVTCRNSIQGKVLIVDDRGYVCPRIDILSNGCCNADSSNSAQYSCETCKDNYCCAIYEYCISCCLHPDKRHVLERVLGKATKRNDVLFASVGDHFELCLAKCRTNSKSVQHENSYRDPRAKHCYGESTATNTASDQIL